MKMVMMARNPALYSHKRLVEAAEARGHTLDIVNTLHCYMNITSHRPELRYRGEKEQGQEKACYRGQNNGEHQAGGRCSRGAGRDTPGKSFELSRFHRQW